MNDIKKILFNASDFKNSIILHNSNAQGSVRFLTECAESDALLGNREIDKRYANIYKKYLRKHIAQYALTVEVSSDFIKSQKSISNSKKNRGQKNSLSFNKTLATINKTLCSCGRDTHFQNVSGVVDIKETSTARRLKGLKSCGNNSACPVCASKLSAVRGNQLKQLMDVGRKNGRSYMMIVSTIPHTPNEALEITLNQVIDMSNFIFNQREYKKFKKLTKCRFVHGGLENMVSFKNGLLDWHPHKNYLLDFDISIQEVIKNLGLSNELELRMYVSRMMTSLGQKYLDKENIQKTLLSPYLQQEEKSKRIHIKAGVSASLEFDDGYIAKWGLDAEMTSGIYKDGRFSESFHPFNLLDFIHQDNQETTKEQKYQCIKAFQEFVLASKGKWWFYFGRGAVAYYNELYNAKLKVKKDEEELLSLEDDGELIYFLSSQEWLDFEPTPKKVGFALSLSTRQDVLEYIFEHIESNRIKKKVIQDTKTEERSARMTPPEVD
jgi:hypothetical protein